LLTQLPGATLAAVIVILKIRNGFVLGSFFVSYLFAMTYKNMVLYLFFGSSLSPAGPSCLIRRPGWGMVVRREFF
jgi:hypothetical protein